MDELKISNSPPAPLPSRKVGKPATDAPLVASSAAGSVATQSDIEARKDGNTEQEQTPDSRSEKVDAAVRQLNSYVQSTQRGLKFQVDEASGSTVITVIDLSTEEVIRQIPDKLALELARSLSADEPISLLNVKA